MCGIFSINSFSRNLENTKFIEGTKKALNKLLPYVIEHKDHRLIIKISEAAYRLNETSLGHEYKGDYLKMIGSLNSAAKFYRLALKYNMKGRMIDQRINSKLKSIDNIRESKDIL